MRVKSQQSVSSTTLLSSLAAWVSQGCFLRDAGFSLLSALAQPGQDGTTSWNLPSITRYIPRVNLSSLWVAQTVWVVASGVLSVAFPRSEWAPPEDSPCLISLSLWCWRISCVILGLLPSLRTPVGPWEGRTGINVSCLLITSSLGEGKAGKLYLTSNLCKKLGLWGKKKKRVENNNICALDGNTFFWSDFWLWKGEQRKMWLPV